MTKVNDKGKLMRKEEALFVSAFFDINRGEWEHAKRSNKKYFDFFDYWARIQNTVVIYVSSEEIAEKIYKIRSKYNMQDRTLVKVVNYKNLELELYNKMFKVAQDMKCRDFRMRPETPETNNADYDLVMLLKSWALFEASKTFPSYNVLAWIDFGFGHGSETFENKEDFEFTAKLPYDNKIHMFSVQELNDMPIIDIVSTGVTFISGSFFYCSKQKILWLWQQAKENMKHLLACGMIDDDQTIWLMCYRDNPDNFVIALNKPLGAFHVGIQDATDKKISFSDSQYKAPTGIRKVLSHIGWSSVTCLKYFIKRFIKFSKILFI